MKNGKHVDMQSPSDFPSQGQLHSISHLEEPVVLGTLVFPREYIGSILSLCESRRGEQRVVGSVVLFQVSICYLHFTHMLQMMKFMDSDRVILQYKLPLAEVVENFYDQVFKKISVCIYLFSK